MIYLVGAVITLIVVVALSGPRVDMNISLNEIELPGNLDLYLSESESRFKDITEGTEKKIIWDGVPGEKNRCFYCIYSWIFSHSTRISTTG